MIDFSFGADSFLYMLFSQKHLKTACFLLLNILKPIRQKNIRTKKQDNFHEKDMSFCSYVLSSSTCKRMDNHAGRGLAPAAATASSAVVMPSVLAVMVVVTAMSFVPAIPALAAFFVFTASGTFRAVRLARTILACAIFATAFYFIPFVFFVLTVFLCGINGKGHCA